MTLEEANDKANLLGRRYGKYGWGCVEDDCIRGLFLVGPVRDGFISTVYGQSYSIPEVALDNAEKFLEQFSEPVSEPEREDLLMAARLIPSEVLIAVLKERGDHLPDAEVA